MLSHKKFLFTLLCLPMALRGHPIPDIPVAGHFQSDGKVTIAVDVDPRSFAEDPEKVPYMTQADVNSLDKTQLQELITQASELLSTTVQLHFEPGEWFLPSFNYELVNRNGGELLEPENEVTIRGTWETQLEHTHIGYSIRSLETAEYAVLFKNTIDGEAQPDVHVLFPEEESIVLDLARMRPPPPAPKEKLISVTTPNSWITFQSFLRQGFVHVLPLGLDHILFVLGIFLLSRHWKPLLLQVSMFTLAHTITLALATLEIVNVPIKPVEIVIAASICVVAIQNMVRPVYTNKRLTIIFILGLIHGLGFASALRDLELSPAALVAGLVGFNLGVEFGQLAVLLMAWVLTLPFIQESEYRRFIVIPVSICITIIGAYWVIERID